jgi:hypothetical protein
METPAICINRLVAITSLLLTLLLFTLSGLAAATVVLVEAGSPNKYLANTSDPGIGID